MKALFAQLAASIGAEVIRRAAPGGHPEGNVPRAATFEIQQAAGDMVRRLFLGRNRKGELAPYDTVGNGALIPLSPYMVQLWDTIKTVVRIPVEQNAVILANKLPADIAHELRLATQNPFMVAKATVQEQIFRPNALATYSPPHDWVDPAGYVLSERVWRSAATTRSLIDSYLETAIREGKGALEISRGLEQYLIPGKQSTTKKPYGTSASYAAMRLARTEITRAHNQAHRMSAAANPFVAGMKWNLSASHPRYDICDEYARGGPAHNGIYSVEAYPEIPHPQCLCRPSNVMVEEPDAILEELRADIQKAKAKFTKQVGPLQVERFTQLLLGQGLGVEYQTPLNVGNVVSPKPFSLPVSPPPAPAPEPEAPQALEPTMVPVAEPLPEAAPLPVPVAEPEPPKLPKDPTETLAWGKEPLYAGQKLNKVALKPAKDDYWLKVEDAALDEPALPTGQRISTGLVVVEPDGRVWIVEPQDHFGGYVHTFPKGGLEQGLTTQQNALKEAFEESGLSARITGYVGDFAGTTGTTRYYLAQRTGGAPWLSDGETATVKLATFDNALGFLNVERDRNVLEAARLALLPKPPAPAATVASGIPDLKDLTYVKPLGGSTGARLFRDAAGKQYVVKGGASEAHVRSEFLADELYRALGANVPQARLVEQDGKTLKISEFIDGTLLNQLSGKKLAAAHVELQKHFAADALLGSWDVIGLGSDNIVVDADGKAWRIDNGGSLLFRAQGAPKSLGNYLDEVWTLRDKKVNSSAAAVFDDMDYGDIAKQLSGLVSKRSGIMEMITDPTLRTILSARLDHAADLTGIYSTLSADKYIDTYIDRFSYHNTWIQSSGVTSTLSKQLVWSNPGSKMVTLVDENGNEFDDLRGANGIYAKFLKELDRRSDGRGTRFMGDWTSGQAFDSWNSFPRLVKEEMMKNRPGDYYWKDSDPRTDRLLEDLRRQFKPEIVTDLSAALNALSYETLRRVDVGIRPEPGVLRLLRTESNFVMQKYGLTKKGQVGSIQRGALESTSLLKPIVVQGAYLTEQDIPIHRVMGFYGFGINRTMYADDGENELLTLLDGYSSRYLRKISR